MTAQVLEFLGGNPGRTALFEAVERVISELGDCELSVAKTQISWGNPFKFAFLSNPPRSLVRQGRAEECLLLSFGLDHREVHPRIAAAANPYPDRWTHHVVLAEPGDINETVKNWLECGYIFAKLKKRRR